MNNFNSCISKRAFFINCYLFTTRAIIVFTYFAAGACSRLRHFEIEQREYSAEWLLSIVELDV